MPAFSAALLLSVAAVPALAAEPAADLQDLRQQCVAAAETAQQDERALSDAERAIALRTREAAGIERELKDTRAEQGQLLAALARLARNPPEAFGVAPEAPLDRIRTGMLVRAAGPALGRDAQALVREFTRLAALQHELSEKQTAAAVQRDNLKKGYASLAELTARRDAAQQKFKSENTAAARLAAAGNLRDLIKTAAAGDKTPGAADPARPKGLRVFDAAAAPMLHPPVVGPIATRFGAATDSDKPSTGLRFSALPGGLVVAPFDGRVDYAGSFRDLGLVLIIWHGGGYHSVLAGLDRIGARPGEWVLAGEPVGAMPGTAAAASGTVLTFELRRDGEPLDPFPSLIDSGEPMGREDAGQARVHE